MAGVPGLPAERAVPRPLDAWVESAAALLVLPLLRVGVRDEAAVAVAAAGPGASGLRGAGGWRCAGLPPRPWRARVGGLLVHRAGNAAARRPPALSVPEESVVSVGCVVSPSLDVGVGPVVPLRVVSVSDAGDVEVSSVDGLSGDEGDVVASVALSRARLAGRQAQRVGWEDRWEVGT